MIQCHKTIHKYLAEKGMEGSEGESKRRRKLV
jgi:hypothetical protein